MADDPHRAIIESADDPIFIADWDGRYIYVNAKAAANFGLTPDVMTGMLVDELFSPAQAAEFRAGVRRVIDSGVANRSEDRLVIGGGVTVWSSTVMQPLRDSDGRVTAVAAIVRDITSHKLAEVALRESEERLRQVIRASNIGVWDMDFGSRTMYWSPQQHVIWGWGPDQPIGWDEHLTYIHPDDRERVDADIARAHHSADGVFETEYRIIGRNDGRQRWVIVRGQTFFEGEGAARTVVRAIGATRDVTAERLADIEHEELQTQLLQSQKLESVGRLAGGIAHDFNNILSIIIGCAEMAVTETEPAVVHEYVEEIIKAATRSADLTRQLLGFARRQTVKPRVVDLNDFVSSSLKMLRRIIGEQINLAWHPGVDVWPVRIDPTQIDQILVNLTANARDAIADTGRVMIQTENISVADSAQYPGLAAREYVRLSVADDGKGMDEETQRHLFEPFYTTKPIGRGTGLGMASVDGIVRQNSGTITVTSHVGQGTTVCVFLPRVAAEVVAVPVDTSVPKRGSERVLVVEDEPALLSLATQALERLGYTVWPASSPEEALAIADRHRGQLDLLVTDVVMPGMNGRNLADRLLANEPKLKCLFVSGYSEGVMESGGLLDRDIHFLQKPFSPKALADRVRQVLEA